jgi:uncharacterized membrane protein YfcA
MDARYSLLGLLVGVLIGLTGMGGGSLMTPLLIVLIHTKATVAVGSDLCYAVQHHRQGRVDHPLAWRLACGSVPGSLLGVFSIDQLRHHVDEKSLQMWVGRMLGVMLVVVAVGLLCRSHPQIRQFREKLRLRNEEQRTLWAVILGLIFGFLVGITSVGSGTLFGILLFVVFGLTPKKVVSTDVFHAAILSCAAAVGHLLAGNVNYSLVGSLLVGSIPGVLIGSRFSDRLPEHVVRPTLAVVLILSGVKMLLP